MPLEAPLAPIAERVGELNRKYRHHSAHAVLEHAFSDPQVGQIAMVSSFGAESAALLHMVSVIDRTTPVLFLDTEMLFPETLTYQQDLAQHLCLTDVRRLRPDRQEVFDHDADGTLNLAEPDACCALRKKAPLERALQGFEAWITGRKRFQTAERATLQFFEDDNGQRIKVNPLAHWSKTDIADYILNNRLPRHPLVSRGFPSIGCMPCTSRVDEGEDERAGRWRGLPKEECGIHIVDGRVERRVQVHVDQNMLVKDTGFVADDWSAGFDAPNALDLPGDSDLAQLRGQLNGVDIIRVDFSGFADGRGFTLARQLRRLGYQGRLRARGPLISDQYAMARRVGFDEVEITPEQARRQRAEDWVFRANWRAHDYQTRLRG